MDSIPRIMVLAGDGIGPEVMKATLGILEWLAKNQSLDFRVQEGLVGGASWDAHGVPLTDATLADALEADGYKVTADLVPGGGGYVGGRLADGWRPVIGAPSRHVQAPRGDVRADQGPAHDPNTPNTKARCFSRGTEQVTLASFVDVSGQTASQRSFRRNAKRRKTSHPALYWRGTLHER